MRPIKKINNTIHNIISLGDSVIHGSSTYPPNVQQILNKYGNATINSMTLRRHPVDKILKDTLNIVSLGKFNKRVEPYDNLYHLALEIYVLNNQKIILEKIERINMSLNIPDKEGTQRQQVNNVRSNMTLYELMNKTKSYMGSQFFSYDAVKNNCQDFIMAVLMANKCGNQLNFEFIKQDTQELFRGLRGTKKIAHFATELGERANIIMQGGGYIDKDIKNYNMVLSHLMSHVQDPNEPIDNKDFNQSIKLIKVIKHLKKSKNMKGGSLEEDNKKYIKLLSAIKKKMESKGFVFWFDTEGNVISQGLNTTDAKNMIIKKIMKDKDAWKNKIVTELVIEFDKKNIMDEESGGLSITVDLNKIVFNGDKLSIQMKNTNNSLFSMCYKYDELHKFKPSDLKKISLFVSNEVLKKIGLKIYHYSDIEDYINNL